MEIDVVNIEELHEAYNDSRNGMMEEYEYYHAISYNPLEYKFDCIKINKDSKTMESFVNKDVAYLWLNNSLDIEKANELLKEYNEFAMAEYDYESDLQTINSINDPVLGIAGYSNTEDSESKYEYDVQVSYDIINQREINEVYNDKIRAIHYTDLTIDKSIESLKINYADDIYGYALNLIGIDKLSEYVDTHDVEILNELKNKGITVQVPIEVEVTETLQKVYTVFAESESHALNIVTDGIFDEFSPLSSDDANVFRNIEIFEPELDEELEM